MLFPEPQRCLQIFVSPCQCFQFFFVVILFNITTICEESQSLFKIKANYTSWHGACTIVKQHQFGPIRDREDTDSFI